VGIAQGPRKAIVWSLAAMSIFVATTLVVVYWPVQKGVANNPTSSSPSIVVTLLKGGMIVKVPPLNFEKQGPFNLTNHSSWDVRATWYQTTETTTCMMTTAFYANWNKTAGPTNCDGWGAYGVSGQTSLPGDWSVFGREFFVVWWNWDATSTDEVTELASLQVSTNS